MAPVWKMTSDLIFFFFFVSPPTYLPVPWMIFFLNSNQRAERECVFGDIWFFLIKFKPAYLSTLTTYCLYIFIFILFIFKPTYLTLPPDLFFYFFYFFYFKFIESAQVHRYGEIPELTLPWTCYTAIIHTGRKVYIFCFFFFKLFF